MRSTGKLFLVLLLNVWVASAASSHASGKPSKWKGQYAGLMQGGSFATTGSVRISLGRSGIGTCVVKIGDLPAQRLAVTSFPRGLRVLRKSRAGIELSGSLTILQGISQEIGGSVFFRGWRIPFHAVRVGTPASVAEGKYTVFLARDASTVSAIGTMTVPGDGFAHLSLNFSDGETQVQSAPILVDGTAPFLFPFPSLSISGRLFFADQPTFDAAALMTFARPNEAQVEYALGASRYEFQAPVLAIENHPDNLLTTNFDGTSDFATLTDDNTFILPETDAGPWTLQLEAETGRLTGSIATADGPLTLRGVVFQKGHAAIGFAGESGAYFALERVTNTNSGGVSASAVFIPDILESRTNP